MALATASPDGTPSVRMVLLRGFEAAGGFVFFTNYESAKAGDLRANPRAAVVFHWPELHRQVRASGAVERLSTPESEAYWAGRPRDHRLGAWVSTQSCIVPDTAEVELAVEQARGGFGDKLHLATLRGSDRMCAYLIYVRSG